MYFVFYRLCPFFPWPPRQWLTVWLLAVISLLLTYTVSRVWACLNILLETVCGSQKQDECGPLSILFLYGQDLGFCFFGNSASVCGVCIMHGEFKLVSQTLDLCIEAAPDPLYENIIHVPASGYSEPPKRQSRRKLPCRVRRSFSLRSETNRNGIRIFFISFCSHASKTLQICVRN
jgi:hypothetical protein